MELRENLCIFPCFQIYHQENKIDCKGFSTSMESDIDKSEETFLLSVFICLAAIRELAASSPSIWRARRPWRRAAPWPG